MHSMVAASGSRPHHAGEHRLVANGAVQHVGRALVYLMGVEFPRRLLHPPHGRRQGGFAQGRRV